MVFHLSDRLWSRLYICSRYGILFT